MGKALLRETAREDYFYWLGRYEVSKEQNLDPRVVQAIAAVVKHAEEQTR